MVAMGAARYEVYRDGRLALKVTDEPGAIISRFAPPPRADDAIERHSFLTASAYLPAEEGELRRLLDESGSTEQFLERLRGEGFTVERVG